VGLGAIVVIGAEFERVRSTAAAGSEQEFSARGTTRLRRRVGALYGRAHSGEICAGRGVEVISVLVPVEMAHRVQPCSVSFENLKIQVVADVSSAVTQKLKDFSRRRPSNTHSLFVPACIPKLICWTCSIFIAKRGKRRRVRLTPSVR